MSWYWIISSTGERMHKVCVGNMADLAANTPEGCTVEPCDHGGPEE